ncbi:MAG: acyl-[acyl-carrier-protein]--UDP-N-acetylglucosamine O-acyltransferase, partial [Planctomycetes bacterium]|nr:acyl-[acyl-carrier-protein]--UDP-N-acetylglucosamine O-acyltransferase [Planctomycetota bacterium]
MSIHPSAIVHPGARLGGRVQIGAFAIIDEEVSLDDDVVIGP